MNKLNITQRRSLSVTILDLKNNIRIGEANSTNSNIRNSKLKNFILIVLSLRLLQFQHLRHRSPTLEAI